MSISSPPGAPSTPRTPLADLDFCAAPEPDEPAGEPRRNQYRGTCVVCDNDVKPLAGKVYKTTARGWATICLSEKCFASVFGNEAADAFGRRFVDDDGVVRMGYDKAALPLLRSIADWDHEAKVWRILDAVGDRRLVREVAGRLSLELPVSWCDDAPEDVQARVAIADAHGARDYQLVGVEWLAQHRAACLSDDQGLGKTFQILHALPVDEALVVVCPSVAKGVWVREIKRWLPSRFDSIHVCKGRKSFRWPANPREAVILNFDILAPQAAEDKGEPCGAPPCPVTVVADEAHALKSFKAMRTKRWRSLASKASHVWGATGTPVENRPGEIWGVLTSLAAPLVSTKCNPFSWRAFLRAFNGQKGRWGGLEFARDSEGAVIVEEGTTELLRRTMLRRLKSDVAKELPPKIYSEHPVELKPALIKQLDELAGTWVDYLLADELPPFEAMGAVRRLLADASTPALLGLVEQYEEQDVPLVVFSAHRGPVEALAARPGWGCIVGGMDAAKRTETEDAFQRGELMGIACTIRAAGTAITLTHSSSMIFVDLDWNPSANTQAEDRCHRIGQTASALDIVRMVPDHALTRHIASLLHAKALFVDRTLHGVATYERPVGESLEEDSAEAWRERVAARAAREGEAQREKRRRELAAVASRKKLSKKQAEERAALRLSSRGQSVVLPAGVEPGDVSAAFAFMLSVCDGAQEKDDAGFNAPDAAISRWVAPAVAAGSPAALVVACTLLRHYPRQLSVQWPTLFGAHA